MGKFTYDINKYEPKQMVALPLGLLIISIIFLAFNTFSTGMPVEPGIDFAGGVAVTVFTTDSQEDIKAFFSDYPLKSIGESVNDGYYLVFDYLEDDKFRDLTKKVLDKYPDAKVDQIGETFGKTLQSQAVWALLIAFILMAIVVFVAFKSFVPSAAVVISAFSDIVITAALMDVFGISLSLGTTAALLMLIGYSVDSDILLTTRLLKRKGNLDEKLRGAFRTGFIMTTTTITAVFAMFVVTAVGQVVIIRDISAVLLIGLFVDMMNTWMLNAGLLKWYLTRKGGYRNGR
ncbi:protein translocase subunit SecF [Methanoplanus sp. FWC-SCC4]|uniref:Protein-export membrane protein SecF n=1 Tax=Methanochimaera problematica TaxID=2609417 RepID=A0AA97FBY9_9EURY|nr:protein translocase subunit SecF [Methanoplanus sp. FWC-SCC4]WOF16062.1 protein translocase subunit SecF [Methanoplanus sp. FWC-SCC4]